MPRSARRRRHSRPGPPARSRSGFKSSFGIGHCWSSTRDELAALITEEHGKIRSEARGRGGEGHRAHRIRLLAAADRDAARCSRSAEGSNAAPNATPSASWPRLSPFNFPSMVPHWTIPNALALGNCMILKPSELVPLSAGRIAELLAEAGLPAGRLQRGHTGAARWSKPSATTPASRRSRFVGSTPGRQARLPSRHRKPQARPRPRRRQESPLRLARRQSRDDFRQHRRLDVGLRRQRCMAASVMLAVRRADHIVRADRRAARDRGARPVRSGPSSRSRPSERIEALHQRG